MQRFAIIETNSGYVWGVVDAESALAACSAVDAIAGGRPYDGRYEEVGAYELRSSHGLYDVRVAPPGFDVDDGQKRDDIAAVEAMPRAGVFRWVQALLEE